MNEKSIITYLISECSPRERKEVENWIDRSTENRKYFEEVKKIWELSRADYSGAPADAEASWIRISTAIQEGNLRIKPVRKTNFRTFWRIAATIVLLLGMGYLALYYSGRETHSAERAVVQAEERNTEVELPDGSKVWLNENAMLSYPSTFTRKERTVTLRGEAFFEVQRERRRVFAVEIGDSRVAVLGTSFNIRAPGEEREQIVTVVTGKVSFHPRGNPTGGVVLTAGEKGVCTAFEQHYSKSVNEDRNFRAWKTGILTFRGTPLEEVCRVISAHYNTDVSLSDSLDPTRQLTATWNNKEPEEVLEILTMTLDLSYRVDGEKVFIY